MKNIFKLLIITIHLSIIALPGQASVVRYQALTTLQNDTLPVPKNIKNLLFYVQRDPNTNTVIYELNQTPDGKLNEKEPVKIYWIRYAEKGVRQDLNYFQRKLAYGINVKKITPQDYELRFVCYPKLVLNLAKDKNGIYHVYSNINQKKAILNRVFVRIQGGTFWVPNVLYADLYEKDLASGKEIINRIKP